MSLTSEILKNIDSFVKTATNFAGMVERNVSSFYKLKDKIYARRQLESIDSVLTIFPQILFFNGVFAASLLRSIKSADDFTKDRDNPTIESFQKVLDNAEMVFDAAAPKIGGLGSEMVLLFKQQIALRRLLLADAEKGKFIDERDVALMMNKLQPLGAVEHRLSGLSHQYRVDTIREAAAKNPSLTEEEIARQLDVSNLVVRAALGEDFNRKSARKPRVSH